jgi:hypothetical protein
LRRKVEGADASLVSIFSIGENPDAAFLPRGKIMTFSERCTARALALVLLMVFAGLGAESLQSQPAATPVSKIGTIKSINGGTLVLKTDSGPEVNVTVQGSTRILRLAPGQMDLKTAAPAELKDLQVGDRMLLRAASEADPLMPSVVVVMKQGDVAQKQQQDRLDWQRRGAGGIVTAIDVASGSVTVAATPTVNFLIKTTNSTAFLRYSPNSVKFADARKGTFDDIKTGDQLRARGNRSADGKEIAAEVVISGTFRNIAGTVSAIDAGNNTITVKDFISKKSVVVKITADSQMRKLTPQQAQRLAVVAKGSAPGGDSPQPAAGGGVAGGAGAPPGRPGGPGGVSEGPGPRGPGGAGMDLQQMLSRVPSITLSDLQKEDAVMIVSTLGDGGSAVLAITLLDGVEPVLTSSPNGVSAAALLSGWNLSAPGGEAGPQ